MKRAFISLSLAALVSGCSQATYDMQSDYKLCKHYLTKPSFNVHYKGVVQAIAKKGLDCDKYLDQALADKAAEEAAAAIANRRNKRKSEIDDLRDEIDQMKIDQSFSCIASGGVQVGNTCMK